jgi:hypothetical protein
MYQTERRKSTDGRLFRRRLAPARRRPAVEAARPTARKGKTQSGQHHNG